MVSRKLLCARTLRQFHIPQCLYCTCLMVRCVTLSTCYVGFGVWTESSRERKVIEQSNSFAYWYTWYMWYEKSNKEKK